MVSPQPVAGALPLAGRDFRKWLGYADKLICFPRALKKAAREADVIHICDHSNAFYSNYLKGRPHVVTCHDLLAVRGALGEETDCPASAPGRVLQRWILNGLKSADAVACVSSYTKQDLERLIQGKGPLVRLVANGINHSYHRLPEAETGRRLRRLGLDGRTPFILHVGSGLRRKNREGILRVFKLIKERWDGLLVLAGERLSAELHEYARVEGISGRIKEISGASNDDLEGLYNGAHALFFPSRYEGFGWPVIEAQACGCPVVCSSRCSLPEVAGDAAFIRDINDENGFADDLVKLSNAHERSVLMQKGFANIQRFQTERMLDAYVELYRLIARAA